MLGVYHKAVLRSGVALIALLSATQAFAQAKTFDIPSEDAVKAIPEFARQAGIQIFVPADKLKGVQTPAVIGDLDLHAALSRLLAGTGATIVSDDGQTIVLSVTPKNVQAASNDGAASLNGSATALETVVVTGTNIRGVVPASPVLEISRAAIDGSGYPTIGQVLSTLPQNFSGGQNPTVGGIGGAAGVNGDRSPISESSSANLRGIGSDSTLSLVDGHRLGFDGRSENVDLSLIPLAAVDKIEIATDGSSAIYGSDAVAGVVNVILRKNYDGVDAVANLGVPTQGGGLQQKYSAIAGTNFASGNIVVAYEYTGQDPLLASDRSVSAATPAPFDLSPKIVQNSLFAAGNYNFSGNLVGHIEGLFAHKDAYTVENDNGTLFTSSGHVQQFGMDGGLDYNFWNDAVASLDLNTAENTQQALEVSGGATSNVRFDAKINSVELKVQAPTLDIPTGELRFVVGGGYRAETLSETGSSNPGAWGRGIKYLYAEANLPLVTQSDDRVGLMNLVLDASVRHEHYDQIGNTTNPKVGLTYTPFSDLDFKGSWGTSFRAPSLDQIHQVYTAGLYPGSILHAPTGNVLVVFGPDENLQPQTSNSWTVSAEYKPSWLSGFSGTVTYFNVQYSNRIANPISNIKTVLTTPADAPFVTLNPSASVQSSYVSKLSLFNNFTGATYDPTSVYALIVDGIANVSAEHIDGVDLLASYAWDSEWGHWNVTGNATWLDFNQELLPNTQFQQVSGTIFNPPSFKMRASLGWNAEPWAATIFLNNVSGETDTTLPATHVNSWTTADLQIGYRLIGATEFFKGSAISVTVENLFDQSPPTVRPTSTLVSGIGFDPANASAYGRTVFINLSKAF